ncbi:MAG: ABC transporter substrate-binding protein [Methanolinea sp.]|nr:ABC transporter substrate-binding protein [Methanolinea sp.]
MKATVLALCLLLTLLLGCSHVSAGLPLDTDGDGAISRGEISARILDTMESGTPVSGSDFDDLRDAAWIFLHWGGRERTVTDSAGRTVTLSRPLRRIIVMNGETLETMRALSVGRDVVVAVDKYNAQKPEFFPEYAGYPSVGSIWAPDLEKIVSLQPDALFLYASVSTAECDEIEKRVRTSLPRAHVFRFDCYRPETYLEDARNIALIFGKEAEFDQLDRFYTSALAGVRDAVGSEPPVPVYIETWNDYKSAGPGSGYHVKVAMAGGANIFSDSQSEYPEVDPESIVARRPHVVVKLAGSGKYVFGGYSGQNATRFADIHRALLARPGWNDLPAAREGRIYILHNAILGGPQYIIGVTYMARWFHPASAGRLDPAGLHREYLVRFQKLDPALARPDLFVYPAD